MNSRHIEDLNARLVVFTLLVSFLAPPQAQAQERLSLNFDKISWGMVRGQTARISVSNPIEPSARKGQGLISIQAQLLDATGAVIATSAERTIPPGEFRSVDFDRDDLPLAGEARGGRVQTSARIRYRFFAIVDRSQLLPPPTSIELIDDLTGHTTVLFGKPKEIVVVGSSSTSEGPPAQVVDLAVIVYSGRALIGMTHGQTLRVSAFDPGDRRGKSARSVMARVSLYGENSELLARSAVVPLPPDGFYSFDFDRSAIATAGGPVGGRLQMRVSLEVDGTHPFTFTQDPKSTGQIPASLELIDNNTGRTAAVWVTIGFFEVQSSPKP